MDDLFDFLFTVMLSFFGLLIIGLVLNGGIDNANDESVDNIAHVSELDSTLNELRGQFAQGAELDIATAEERLAELDTG